jgi:hypothetical protein
MLWKRRTNDARQIKFKKFEKTKDQSETVDTSLPESVILQLQAVTAEKEVVPEEYVGVESTDMDIPRTTGFVGNIVTRIRKDRFMKILIALQAIVLLILVSVVVLSSNSIITGSATLEESSNNNIANKISAQYHGDDNEWSSSANPTSIPDPAPKQIIVGDASLSIKLLASHDDQVRGLRFTQDLDANEGMLYMFDSEGYHAFWTKDMRYPIDIIFISAAMEVVDILQDISPCGQSCPIYRPGHAAAYVLEVNGGYVDQHHIEIGDPASLIY